MNIIPINLFLEHYKFIEESFIWMYLLLISLFSIKIFSEYIPKNIQTFSVFNFGDYSFQLDNINDELIIEVPCDTLIFISSLS